MLKYVVCKPELDFWLTRGSELVHLTKKMATFHTKINALQAWFMMYVPLLRVSLKIAYFSQKSKEKTRNCHDNSLKILGFYCVATK